MKDIINQTLSKANRNRNLYKQNEFAVRDHLVNPILTFLGWDVTDAEFVIPNDPAESNAPDYTLVKGGKKISYLEPKNLSEDLYDHITPLVAHCRSRGSEFGVLTNGIKWILLKTFGNTPKPKDRIIWQVDLENDSPMHITKRFKSIEYDNVERIEHLIEKEKILNEAWEDYLRNPIQLNEQIAELFKGRITSQFPNIDFDEEAIKQFFKRRLNEWVAQGRIYSGIGGQPAEASETSEAPTSGQG